MKQVLLLSILLLLAACKSDTKPSGNLQQSGTPSSTSANIPPGIPNEKMIDLYENVDFIDFIFRDLPFSISQEDKASIQQTIRHINNVPPPAINPNCEYFAQQIFQENGEIVLDAKIFFQEGCTYYLFYENGVAKYSGSFTPEGIQFYNSILAQAEQVRSNG
jgi:hypothetical protein